MSRLLRIVGCAGLLSAVVILGATFVVPLAAGASTQRGSTRLIDTNRVVGFPRQTVVSTGEQATPSSLSGRGKAVAPKITLQPASDTVSVGSTASFSAAASGSPTPTVHWKDSTNGSTWSTIRGATSTTYSFTASSSQSGYEYEAVFTNSAGTATTTAATLTVTANASDTITFNSEGGSTVAPVTDPVGTQITLPSDTYAGHTFDGWFVAPSGGSALTSPYTITATTTLYAQWTANASDTITFNSEGGVAVAPVTDPVGTQITLPSDTYAGHTFDGWFVAASGGSALTSPYTITATTTLYAQWTANASNTITFNSEGGVAVAPVTDPVGTQITLPSDTYAGHTFDGWFVAASGGSALTSPYTITATTTLYAQWTANASDTITFNSEGGVAVAPVTDPVGTQITLPSDTYAGHTFDGWFVAASGGSALTSPYTITATTTLYAQWTANASDTITFNSEGGVAVAPVTDPVGTQITLPSDTYAGHTFDGWFVAASGGSALTSPYTITATTTLYAVRHQFTDRTAELALFGTVEHHLPCPSASAISSCAGSSAC